MTHILERHLGRAMLFVLPALVTACGGNDVGTVVRIGALVNAAARESRDAFADLPAFGGHYGYAQVDGIKITINKVRGNDANSDNPLTSIDLNKGLTLANTVESLGSLSFAVGSYRQVELIVKNTWQLKGYCKVNKSGANYDLIYTTASGFTKKTCTGGCTTADLTGYDYTPERFMMHNTDFSSTSDAMVAEQYLQTNYLFNIAADSTPTLSVLYDPTYFVMCWDGASWSDSATWGGFTGVHSPQREVFYPDGHPTMTGGYLPAMAYLSTDGSEAGLYARTFTANSATGTPVVDPASASIDWKSTAIATFLYREGSGSRADSIVQGISRNYQGNSGQNVIALTFEGITAASGGGFDFYMSNWYWAGGTATPRFIRNYAVSGFNPPATPATFTSTSAAGPDCGQSFVDFQGHEQSQPCEAGSIANPRTIYWHELIRNI